ncbi:hypothetical protein EAH89_15720 [Roseomonas nepalensis]|uniref:RAMA domain-containing protein n=1 Tax=Muricoccus nepalensis TaxID=1854500 RepID=A0A502FW05_9PROT|nr:hypothetical protein [Roseomonas nepalensis]TPG53654.1 hypothetical protein EAH89_15720 [Roseomonas nepalensis]
MLIHITTDKAGGDILPMEDVEPVTFASLALQEAHLEEFLRQHIELLFEDDEERSLLIVGQQVKNAQNARNDLVALDSRGNLVLIEVKRDAKDMVARAEALEFQAIRYAASLATIADPDTLVEKLFARYIRKHADEFKLGDFTPEEMGRRKVNEFLAQNGASASFNRQQSIMLVSSSFDAQTLSAAAWLSSNGIEIECLSLNPVRIGGDEGALCLAVERLVPLPKVSDLLVGFTSTSETGVPIAAGTTRRQRTSKPKMAQLIEWGIVRKGQILSIKGHPGSEATVLGAKKVSFQGQDITFNEWGRMVTGWSAVGIYLQTVTEEGRSLDDLRDEHMKLEQQHAAASA